MKMNSNVIDCNELYNIETSKYNNALKSLKHQLNVELNNTNKLNILKINKYHKMIVIKNNYNNSVKKLTTTYNQIINNLYAQTMNNYNKKALLFGLNYIGTSSQLFGCINDTINVKNILQTNFAYNYFNVLTDKTNKKPNKQNILSELTNLLLYSKAGDNLFFLYSGHGTNTVDLNNDEIDGKDELIVPLDARSIKTCISDDDLKKIITTYLKKDVKLFMLFDACFSGTIVDLKYNYLINNNINNVFINSKNSETKGQVIVISGCKDDQTSADAYVSYLNKNMYSGAMTYSFLKTIQELGTSIKLNELVTNMRKILVDEGYEQIPQLSSGTNIDINMVLPI